MNKQTLGAPTDPMVRQLRQLQQRSYRERSGLYYVAGMRFISAALRYNAPIETLVVCPPQLQHPLAKKLVAQLTLRGTPTVNLTPEAMRSLAFTVDAQGIGAVVRQKWQPLERVKLNSKLCWIGLERVQSPGNLGTILRTAEAVGAAGLILLGDEIDPYDPLIVRPAMGAHFAQRFVRTTLDELVAWKERHGWTLIGTTPATTLDYAAATYPRTAVLLLGWERQGLSDEILARCDMRVRIPMVGHTDSLNLSVAAGVVLYEMFNQRRRMLY